MENVDRYTTAMHAIQSAVAYDISHSGVDGAGANPKHLRVGINSALVDGSAIASLLISKGIITKDEYISAIADAAEQEVERLTKHLRDKTGIKQLSFA